MSLLSVTLSILAFVILLLFIIVLFMPVDKISKKKKKEKYLQHYEMQKDWKQAALRLEKYTSSLRHEIDALERKCDSKEKQVLIEKARVKKMQERLHNEKKWQEKEKNAVSKQNEELNTLKKDLVKTQDLYAKEHGIKLQLESKIKELESKCREINDQRRAAESLNGKLETKINKISKEILDLKRENAELVKKKEDVSWIAKSEYEEVKKLLKEKEKELERINRER